MQTFSDCPGQGGTPSVAEGPTALQDGAARQVWTKTANRPLRRWMSSLGLWLLIRGIGVPVPWGVVRQKNAAELLAFEAHRLTELAAAGEAVPQVVSFDGWTLVTRDVGPSLNSVLEKLPERHRLSMMCEVCADLARFHARGHWHGGAQVRNMTLLNGVFHRIDFEEPMYPALPLSTVQAYDAVQLTVSMLRWLMPLGDKAILEALNSYVRAAPACGAALVGMLQPLLPRIRWVVWVTGWQHTLRHHPERQRLVLLLNSMETFVRDGKRGSPQAPLAGE